MMNNNSFKVFVKCFTYNHAKYIIDTLDGFVMQKTNFPYLCCIIDDASTDQAQELIQRYIQENFEIENPLNQNTVGTVPGKVFFARHKKNIHCHFYVVLLNENHYSKKKSKLAYYNDLWTNSKYVAFCEGDDYWISPDKLQKQEEWLDGHEEYSLAYTKHVSWSEETGLITLDKTLESICAKLGDDITGEDILCNRRIPLTCTVMARRELIDDAYSSDAFLFSPGRFLLDDVSLWYSLSQFGKIHFVDETCSVYRELKSSASSIQGNKNKYKFGTSAWALRAYLCRRDNLSKKTTALVEHTYATYCLPHQALNPDFIPVIPVSRDHQKKYWILSDLKCLGIWLRLSNLLSKIKNVNKK